MADFIFGFTEGSFLLLNSQKHLGSVAENLTSNKQNELNEFIKNGEGTDIIKLSSQYFLTGHNFVSFLLNIYHVMKTSSVQLKYRITFNGSGLHRVRS